MDAMKLREDGNRLLVSRCLASLFLFFLVYLVCIAGVPVRTGPGTTVEPRRGKILTLVVSTAFLVRIWTYRPKKLRDPPPGLGSGGIQTLFGEPGDRRR
jgi:hypothetical protein